MSRYYVYVLKSIADNKLYIGFTTNLKERLTSHSKGLVSSTKNRRYLKLIHYEYFINSLYAKSREVFLKSGAGHAQLKPLRVRLVGFPSAWTFGQAQSKPAQG